MVMKSWFNVSLSLSLPPPTHAHSYTVRHGNHGNTVYTIPPACVLHVTENPGDDAGEEDADGDEELVQRHQTTSDVGWRRFRHVHGYRHGGKPWRDRQTVASHWSSFVCTEVFFIALCVVLSLLYAGMLFRPLRCF